MYQTHDSISSKVWTVYNICQSGFTTLTKAYVSVKAFANLVVRSDSLQTFIVTRIVVKSSRQSDGEERYSRALKTNGIWIFLISCLIRTSSRVPVEVVDAVARCSVAAVYGPGDGLSFCVLRWFIALSMENTYCFYGKVVCENLIACFLTYFPSFAWRVCFERLTFNSTILVQMCRYL